MDFLSLSEDVQKNISNNNGDNAFTNTKLNKIINLQNESHKILETIDKLLDIMQKFNAN